MSPLLFDNVRVHGVSTADQGILFADEHRSQGPFDLFPALARTTVPEASFQVGDARQLPWPDDEFDVGRA
jgi:hypothetical protein